MPEPRKSKPPRRSLSEALTPDAAAFLEAGRPAGGAASKPASSPSEPPASKQTSKPAGSVMLSVRLTPDLAEQLDDLCARRRLERVEPCRKQDVVQAALRAYLGGPGTA